MTREEGLNPAFPVPSHGYSGVTVRDYFATEALQAIIMQSTNAWDPKAFAEMAYETADAMIEERAKV